MDQSQDAHIRIFFRLEKEDSGYPPDDVETLWAKPISNNLFQVDNIPFFIKGISDGDVVSVMPEAGEKWFKSLEEASGHSTLRIMFYDESQVPEVRQVLSSLGCDSEISHIPSLIAVDVPPSVKLEEVLTFLEQGEKAEQWEYQEAAIRHNT